MYSVRRRLRWRASRPRRLERLAAFVSDWTRRRSAQRINHLLAVPSELLGEILQHLSATDLAHLMRTSRLVNAAVRFHCSEAVLTQAAEKLLDNLKRQVDELNLSQMPLAEALRTFENWTARHGMLLPGTTSHAVTSAFLSRYLGQNPHRHAGFTGLWLFIFDTLSPGSRRVYYATGIPREEMVDVVTEHERQAFWGGADLARVPDLNAERCLVPLQPCCEMALGLPSLGVFGSVIRYVRRGVSGSKDEMMRRISYCTWLHEREWNENVKGLRRAVQLERIQLSFR